MKQKTSEKQQTAKEIKQLKQTIQAIQNKLKIIEKSLDPNEKLEDPILIDTTKQIEQIQNHIQIPEQERLAQLLKMTEKHGLTDLDKQTNASQVEADAIALYRAMKDQGKQSWLCKNNMKSALSAMRGIETNYQINRMYRACERLEELSNGSICFETNIDDEKRLRKV